MLNTLKGLLRSEGLGAQHAQSCPGPLSAREPGQQKYSKNLNFFKKKPKFCFLPRWLEFPGGTRDPTRGPALVPSQIPFLYRKMLSVIKVRLELCLHTWRGRNPEQETELCSSEAASWQVLTKKKVKEMTLGAGE